MSNMFKKWYFSSKYWNKIFNIFPFIIKVKFKYNL